jgi:hypothetical protein
MHWKSNATSLPFRNQVEKFFEPSVNANVEGIKSITAETDPTNTVRARFSLWR